MKLPTVPTRRWNILDPAHADTFEETLRSFDRKWQAGDQADQTEDDLKLVRALAAKSFGHNPLAGAGNPFFPDKCLAHGCTSWGWGAAAAFVDEFFDRLSVAPAHEKVRAQLVP